MIDALGEMLKYEFMQHAFIAGTLAAVISGFVGYFVILRNLAFAAHALGHVGFAGASGALLLGCSPIMGQFVLTLLAAASMGALGKRIHKNDMVIGVVLSFCLGLGTLFLYLYQGYAGQASLILFGNLLGVSTDNLHLMWWLMVISILIILLFAKRLLFASIEPELAEAKGLSLARLSIIFLLILALAVTLASQVVGVILVFTLIIGPPAIALQWSGHFSLGCLFSIVLALLIVWLGITFSYFTDYPISFWISTIVFLFYLTSTFIKYVYAR